MKRQPLKKSSYTLSSYLEQATDDVTIITNTQEIKGKASTILALFIAQERLGLETNLKNNIKLVDNDKVIVLY